jgi:hypothetical protein
VENLKNKKAAATLVNWKVDPDLLQEINIECATTRLKQAQLARKAMGAYWHEKWVQENTVPKRTDFSASENPADGKLRVLFEGVLAGLSTSDRQTLTGLLEYLATSQRVKKSDNTHRDQDDCDCPIRGTGSEAFDVAPASRT